MKMRKKRELKNRVPLWTRVKFRSRLLTRSYLDSIAFHAIPPSSSYSFPLFPTEMVYPDDQFQDSE